MTIAFDTPVTASYTAAPLSLQAADFASTVTDGAVAVDLRSARTRQRDGILVGAVALDVVDALDLLSPDSAYRLRTATADTRWVIVSDDGYDAEMLAWHLQARGVRGARFVVGGYAALRSERIGASVDVDAVGLYV